MATALGRNLIKIEQLSYSYMAAVSPVPVLDGLTFDLEPGEITMLMGPSGCGKSTLLRVLMGIEKAATGQLSCDEKKFDLATWTAQQSIFGLVPQVPHLFPWKTVFENIELAIPEQILPQTRRERVLSALQLVQLEKNAGDYPAAISQGMASRVAFARTIVMNSPALLLDEPFAALDAMTRLHLQKWIRQKIKDAGLPALFVTHDIHEALLIGSNIHVMNGMPARIVASFSAGEATADKVASSLASG